MPLYKTSVRASVAAASGAAYATFHTAARRAAIREIDITIQGSATTAPITLFRASNTPVATTSTTPQPADTADAAATCALDTAWSTPPTVGANSLQDVTLGPAVGSGFFWNWARDGMLIVPTTAWLVFWNASGSAGPALSISIHYEE